MGYSSSASTEFDNKTNDIKNLLKIKDAPEETPALLLQLEKTDTCDSVVAIKCQDYSKYTNKRKSSSCFYKL